MYKKQHKTFTKAFTLIELAITIVIIGLIVAGVLAGQVLVQQAQLRSIISEQDQIKVAIQNFRLIYDAEPGDFDDAYSYWGCGANANECNGNGNGLIQTNTSQLLTNIHDNEDFFHLTSSSVYIDTIDTSTSTEPNIINDTEYNSITATGSNDTLTATGSNDTITATDSNTITATDPNGAILLDPNLNSGDFEGLLQISPAPPKPYGQIVGSGTENESFRAWQHLNAAGLYPGNFSGISLDTDDPFVNDPNYIKIGVNVPASNFNGAGLSFGTIGYITISGDSNPVSVYDSTIFTQKQAYSIDGKIDDGLPLSGNVGSFCKNFNFAYEYYFINLSNNLEYDTSSENIDCIIGISIKNKVNIYYSN